MNTCPPRIALAAGGTGGHLFPAIALGRELQRRGYVPHLFTDKRGMRFLQKSDWRNEHVTLLAAATFAGKKNARQYFLAGATIIGAVIAAWRLLGRVRACVAVGFGGYPSFAPLLAARLRGIPVCLHEQNAVFGRANKILAPLAKVVAFAFPSNAKPNATVTGTPVREEVLALRNVPYSAPQVSEPFRILVFGGSQGARILSSAMPEIFNLLPESLRSRIHVVQQCRDEDIDELKRSYQQTGIVFECAPFFSDLPQRIANAHIVVARAGASTIAELTVIGRPSILLPLPDTLDADQFHNANILKRHGGAWVFEQDATLVKEMAHLLHECMESPAVLEKVAVKARDFGKPDAAKRLADIIEHAVQPSSRLSQ